MKLLITGGSSYLGQHLVPLAVQQGYDVVYTWFSSNPLSLKGDLQLNIRDGDAVMSACRAIQPEAVLHLVGSNRPEAFEAVIEEGTEHIVRGAEALGVPLVHVSTDVVFDGTEPPYGESDPPRPKHSYGVAKFAAEKVVQQLPNHKIVRTSLIYGLQQIDRGTEWMRDALEAGRPVTLFSDQMRNPVQAETLAAAILELATHEYVGVLHVAGEQVLSRADFARRMLSWWGISGEGEITVQPQPPDAPWPLDTTLDISLAQALLKTPLLGVDAALLAAEKTG